MRWVLLRPESWLLNLNVHKPIEQNVEIHIYIPIKLVTFRNLPKRRCTRSDRIALGQGKS